MQHNKKKIQHALHDVMEFAVEGLESSIDSYLNLREAASKEMDITKYESKISKLLKKIQPISISVKIKSEKQKTEYLRKPISDFDVSNRILSGLMDKGINTVEELVSKHEADIYGIRNLGDKSFNEIKEKILSPAGLNFRGYEED